MTLETFFEKFDLFADAPDAVAKLRELVLDWAVTGKLCHTDSAEWSEGVLGDVIELISGQHLLGHEHNAEGRGIPYLTGPSDFGEKNPIPTRWTEQPKVTAKPGDILITVKGAGVGKTNVLIDQPTAISRQLMAIRVTGAEPEFVHFVLKRAAEHFQNTKIGIAIPGIGRREVLCLKVVLPSPAEQKRIVAKVDELMTLCDRLEALQQERETRHSALARASLARFADAPTPANLDLLFHKSYSISPTDLRKSILTLAVQGKLVPQDPNDENVEGSLARNDARRREAAEKDHRAEKENQPLLYDDDRWEIPETWSWRGLADLVLFVDYRGKTPIKLSRGIRLLTAKNVRKGQINLSPEEFLSESDYREWMTRGFPKAGDVLFTTEAPMGNAAVVELMERFALAQRVICFQSYGAIDPAFLVMQILSDQFQFILDKNATGVTAKGIKASKLKQLPIAVPPLAEQRRIVAKMDELMALVDALEAQLATARTTAEKLMEAVVAELTTQD